MGSNKKALILDYNENRQIQRIMNLTVSNKLLLAVHTVFMVSCNHDASQDGASVGTDCDSKMS